jgi:methylated-DNA-[protein]-cysteine S-methyltransferase
MRTESANPTLRAQRGPQSRNPASIIVPFHCVIGRSGMLTGYAGGLERKRYLLALESDQRALRA